MRVRCYLLLVVIWWYGCKKAEHYTIQEHPDYQSFLGLFKEVSLPLDLRWKSTAQWFEWSQNSPIEEKFLKIFVDSLASKQKVQYFPYAKILLREDFCVLLLGRSGTVEDMPGWLVLSLRKDGEILGKEYFRFAKNSIGSAHLSIDKEGGILYERALKIFEQGAVRNLQNVYRYRIDDEGRIKEKDEDQSESLTVIPNSVLNLFSQASTPFYILSDFLNSVNTYRVDEYQELLHENWYNPMNLDTAVQYFPPLERILGDRIQVACGAYKLIYKHQNFSVGVLVTRQAGNTLRAGVTAFHLFTFDRKKQKMIDFLPMVAYIVESWNEEKQQNEYSVGSFQFFDDMRFVLRNLKGTQESSQDILRSGYIKEDGYFFLMQ